VRRLRIPNRFFFYTGGFACDCYNYVAILSEAFFAAYVLRASEFEMGLLGASSAIGYALPCIATGLLSEKIGRRRTLLMATAGQAVVYLLTPRVSTIGLLCLMSFLRSVATSFYWPPLMAWMSETSDTTSLSGIIGGFNVSWALGCVAGLAVSGVMFEYLSPAAPFLAASALAGAMFLFFLSTAPARLAIENHDHGVPPHRVQSFVREGLILNCLGFFVVALVLYMFPKIAGLGMGEAEQSTLHVGRMLAQAVTFLIFAHTRAWHYRRWPVTVSLVAFVFGLILCGLTRSYWIYLIGFVLLGIGTGIGYTLSIYYTLALLRRKGLGSGMQESLIGLGILFGPLYGGTVATLTSPRGSLFAAVLPVLGMWAYVRHQHAKNRSSSDPA
jgi:MFS family permease